MTICPILQSTEKIAYTRIQHIKPDVKIHSQLIRVFLNSKKQRAHIRNPQWHLYKYTHRLLAKDSLEIIHILFLTWEKELWATWTEKKQQQQKQQSKPVSFQFHPAEHWQWHSIVLGCACVHICMCFAFFNLNRRPFILFYFTFSKWYFNFLCFLSLLIFNFSSLCHIFSPKSSDFYLVNSLYSITCKCLWFLDLSIITVR